MKGRDKLILWLLALLVGGYFIYLIKSILTPFLISLILAYFLHPLVNRLVASGRCSRLSAIALILGLSLSLFFAVAMIVLPIVYLQLSQMLSVLPYYFSVIVADIYPKIVVSLKSAGINIESDLTHILNNQQFTDSALDFLKNFSRNIFSSSVAVINVLSLIFITPILIFYLLKDWEILVANFNKNLPKKSLATLQILSKEIDKTLAGYVRGQAAVCLILAILYSILLSFTGLNFGFLIGFLTGVFAFIPFVGALSGVVCAVLVALFQWGFDFVAIAPVLGVFVVGQILESNFLTPKLVGEKVGLHPVWIIFGLFVFGVLFGFIGVLFATPLTAIFGVLIRHFSLEYKKRFT